MPTTTPNFVLAPQVNRVPSMRVSLDTQQERRFQRLMEDLVLIDVHQHPMVLAADANQMPAYFRANSYAWGLEAVAAGGWTAVGTANLLACLRTEPGAAFSHCHELVDAGRMLLADVRKQCASGLRLTSPRHLVD